METNERVKQELREEAEAIVYQLVEKLATLNTGDFEEGEGAVFHLCLSLGRKWMERVLDERAQGHQPAARREGECGHRQRLVGDRPKHILTMMGEVQVQRPYYQCLRKADEEEREGCSHGEAPWDRTWGIGAGRTSQGVQKLVSYLVANLTQEGVAEAVSRVLPLSISARQVLNLIQPVGEVFQQQEEEQMRDLFAAGADKHRKQGEGQDQQGESIKRMYVEMDGVMARMRRGSVPMEKQEQEQGGDVYREVKVGAAFVGEPGPERSELVPGVFVDQPGPITYVARRTTVDAFAPLLYALAQQAGITQAEQVVVLGDGALWIWRVAEEQFPGAVQIVDEYHACEHVWDVARAAFAADPQLRDNWARTVTDQLAEGKIEEVIVAIKRLPPLAPPPGKARSILEIEADYFRRNAERMRYPIFRAQGMHVGSGIAEAACKTVVSTRTKRSGMRWTPDGLDALLALRTAVLNKDFDQCWQASRKAA